MLSPSLAFIWFSELWFIVYGQVFDLNFVQFADLSGLNFVQFADLSGLINAGSKKYDKFLFTLPILPDLILSEISQPRFSLQFCLPI